MKCVYCKNSETKVIETRESSDSTRRRRECLTCLKRFTTYEKPEIIELFVIKKGGHIQPFSKQKLQEGITRACEKRPVSMEQIENAANRIEIMLKKRKGKEVTSKELGSMVLTQLKRLDKVAYIRFASVYREFEDLASFQVELKKIIKTKEN